MDDIVKFTARLAKWAANSDLSTRRSLDRVGHMMITEIHGAIGTYKYGWPQLSAAAIAKKGGDTPLLTSGEQRDSYKFQVGNDVVDVGSDNPKAQWSELGSGRVPPRPVLVPATLAREPEIVATLGDGALKALDIKR